MVDTDDLIRAATDQTEGRRTYVRVCADSQYYAKGKSHDFFNCDLVVHLSAHHSGHKAGGGEVEVCLRHQAHRVRLHFILANTESKLVSLTVVNAERNKVVFGREKRKGQYEETVDIEIDPPARRLVFVVVGEEKLSLVEKYEERARKTSEASRVESLRLKRTRPSKPSGPSGEGPSGIGGIR